MAEELTNEELEILIRHLERFPDSDTCPVCRTMGWEVIGIEAAQGYYPRRRGQEALLGFRYQKDVLPVVTLVCNTCGYARSFAWNVILHAAGFGVRNG